MNTRLSKGANPSDTLSLNMKLLAHHELEGFGGIGEGINIQQAPDARRILWLAHESAPKNFTGVDVTDPRKPKVVVQTRRGPCKICVDPDCPEKAAAAAKPKRRSTAGGKRTGRLAKRAT